MKSSLLLNLLFVGVLLCFSSCKSDESLPADPVTAISSASFSFEGTGGSQNITFTASNDWKLQSSDTWLTVSKSSGTDGAMTVTITTAKNETNTARTGTLTLVVDGYDVSTTLCTVSQAAARSGVNQWMADYMSEAYLWNTEFNTIKEKLDYTLEPEDFLDAALAAMKTNTDDGYTVGDDRYYFSYIEETASSGSRTSTRAIQGESTDFGIGSLFSAVLTKSPRTYALGVSYVYAGSPAAMAGLKRGTMITKYNGETITASNLSSTFYTLIGYDKVSSATLTTQSYTYFNEENKVGYYLSDKETTVTLNKASYDQNPILASTTIKPENSSHVIGYFAYAGFDYYHDQKMLDAFAKFKQDGITDLVIDLRYNGGGYVNSSAALATLVAGSGYEGRVYSGMQYNANRAANGEIGYYYIGKSPAFYDTSSKQMVTDNYAIITKALSSAVNLKKIYVLTTDNTASASELIINGLRGLDLSVVTVGTTTIGKNVGMEVIESDDYKKMYDFKGSSYEFAPITFKSYNEKKQSDYSEGFEPDCEVEETARRFDWGSYSTVIASEDYSNTVSVKNGADPMLSCAIYNIINGSWPNAGATTKAATRALSTSVFERSFAKMARQFNMRGAKVIKRLPKE